MMSKQTMDSRMEEAKISLDALVPKNYLVRKIDKSLSFDFIYLAVFFLLAYFLKYYYNFHKYLFNQTLMHSFQKNTRSDFHNQLSLVDLTVIFLFVHVQIEELYSLIDYHLV